MKSIYQKENKRLIFQISEDIDECTSQNIRRKLDNEIERYMPKEVIFDFNNVSFMDSAGIGLIIGRYKLANMLGGKVQVSNLTSPVRKIFEMSGILKIIPECTNTEKSVKRTVPFEEKSVKRTVPFEENSAERTVPFEESSAKRTVPDADVPFNASPLMTKEVKYETHI